MALSRFWLFAGLFLVTHSPLFAEPIYLAIGDSSAYGETNRTKNPSDGDRGYVSMFADYLGTTRGYNGTRPSVLNLAINGETTYSYSTGTGRVSSDGQGFNTNYNGLPVPYAQKQRLADLLGSPTQAGNVKNITLQLGANNLDAVGAQPDFLSVSDAERQARVGAALQKVQQDYAEILTELKTKYPNADIYAMGYHNPYNGDATHPFHPLADAAIRGLNQVIEGVSTAYGVSYVDVYGAINPNEAEFSLINTWQTDPINYVHLNEAGYEQVGNQLIATASANAPPGVPEPTSWLLLAIAGGSVVMVRQLRQRRAAATAL